MQRRRLGVILKVEVVSIYRISLLDLRLDFNVYLLLYLPSPISHTHFLLAGELIKWCVVESL
jgi:hypothetical protein